MGSKKSAAATLFTVVVAMAAAGCGGSSSSPDTHSNPGPATKSESFQSQPSAEFMGKGPNGKLATVGKEASAAEREAASQVLEENLQGRAAEDWAGQCSTLAAPLVKQIEETATVLNAATGCAKALEAQAVPAAPSALANTMTGPIDAFRVNGAQAFAFWHGTEGKDYVMPLIKEGNEWKVASLVTQKAP
jgi:hypothetical protein